MPIFLSPSAQALLGSASMEVMPRTLSRVEDAGVLLPKGSHVSISHLEGVSIGEMIAAAGRLADAGYRVQPHFPARLISSLDQLHDWLGRYRARAGIRDAMVIAGSAGAPRGPFNNSMALLETGAFQRYGIRHISVAGYPEGNKHIDTNGETQNADAALTWKRDYAKEAGLDLSIVTQFVFKAEPLLAFERRLRHAGLDIPIRAGLSGPAHIPTVVDYARISGIGGSLSGLLRQGRNIRNLIRPHSPDTLINQVAKAQSQTEDCLIQSIHLCPLGGILKNSEIIRQAGGSSR